MKIGLATRERKRETEGKGRNGGQKITDEGAYHRSAEFTRATRYVFSLLLPQLLPRLLSLPGRPASYNPQITNLTPERLKDQALFEVDSKEVIPAQDLARIRRKKPTKER